ncbi:hypothetical protein SRHO_G00180640 [Serrasalmus rhombeus]
MEAEHKEKKSGKRKERQAKGSCGPTKKRELKEDSGFINLAPVRQKQEKTCQALYVDMRARSYCVLPPIKASCPPPVQAIKGAWLEKVGLDVFDDPSPPPPVQPETSPEMTFYLPSESLDTLFSARLLGNETPEMNGIEEFLASPEHEREESQARVEEVSSAAGCHRSPTVEEVTLSRDPEDSKVLTLPPTFIKKMAEELVKRLESLKVGVLVVSLYERLVERLIDELETMSHIKITHQVLGGRLFSDENAAVSHIVNEAYKSLLNKHLTNGASYVDQWTIRHAVNAILIAFADYALGCFHVSGSSPDTDTAVNASQGLGFSEVQKDSDQRSRTNEFNGRSKSAASINLSTWSCSTILSEPEFEDQIRECGGSPDHSDLSDECSEIYEAYQNYRRYGPKNRPGTYLVRCTESPLEDSPDLSSSTPAVQVTEASDHLEENKEDLETPAHPDGTEDTTACRTMKKQRLSSRVFKFLRSVFCFGCIPSRRVEPL